MISRVFRDKLFILVMGFAMMVAFMLPYLNDPSKRDNAEPPGNVIAAITWPAGNTDVDLWVTGPGEVGAVGYSNKNGLLWNLLRDDLGTSPDATSLNYENAYTRGILPGEYIVNVHCYRCPVLPINVEVEISIKNDMGDKSGMKILATTVVPIKKDKTEHTAIRFKLDDAGNVVPNTMNNVYKPLRSITSNPGRHPGGRQ